MTCLFLVLEIHRSVHHVCEFCDFYSSKPNTFSGKSMNLMTHFSAIWIAIWVIITEIVFMINIAMARSVTN